LDKDFCNLILSSFDANLWFKHSYEVESKAVSFSTDFQIWIHEFPNKQKLVQKIWDVINQYVTKDMAHMHAWFNNWNGFSPPRINKYTPGTKMVPHWDGITTIFDGERRGIPTLTILGALNDEYEDGELLMWGEPFELKAGDILVFPSTFLYPHSVNAVKSGTRYSFVSWAW
jgi:predicted 2-oxoglutarate/Fe(II)-dependent dioxygenase YbiX